MKLYVCWNTGRGPFGHPCGEAHHALREAGHDPQVIKAYGFRRLPRVFNRSAGRREAERLTGDIAVPVLVTADGAVVGGSSRIIAWAAAHPAAAPPQAAGGPAPAP